MNPIEDIYFIDGTVGRNGCASAIACFKVNDYRTPLMYSEKHPETQAIIETMLEEASEPAMAMMPKESAWLAVVIIVIQVGIFIFSMFGLYKLWKDILNFISNSSDSKIKHLLSALGTSEVSYSKTKIMGTGIAITTVILALVVGAMWVIGNVRIY